MSEFNVQFRILGYHLSLMMNHKLVSIALRLSLSCIVLRPAIADTSPYLCLRLYEKVIGAQHPTRNNPLFADKQLPPAEVIKRQRLALETLITASDGLISPKLREALKGKVYGELPHSGDPLRKAMDALPDQKARVLM